MRRKAEILERSKRQEESKILETKRRQARQRSASLQVQGMRSVASDINEVCLG